MPFLRVLSMSFMALAPQAWALGTDQWSVDRKVDSMTDTEIRTAAVTNADGFTLRVYRLTPGGRVWGNFEIPADSLDVLDTALPMFRIDKLEPVQVETSPEIASVTGATVEAKPKWVNFLLWHGEGNTPVRGTLRNLMDGSAVVFRYYLFTGGYKETRFNLSGAKPAIAQALAISEEPAVGAAALEEAQSSASSRCADLALARKREKLQRCLAITMDCSTATTADHFQACLDRNSFSGLFR